MRWSVGEAFGGDSAKCLGDGATDGWVTVGEGGDEVRLRSTSPWTELAEGLDAAAANVDICRRLRGRRRQPKWLDSGGLRRSYSDDAGRDWSMWFGRPNSK
jgi:hypothetical protein